MESEEDTVVLYARPVNIQVEEMKREVKHRARDVFLGKRKQDV